MLPLLCEFVPARLYAAGQVRNVTVQQLYSIVKKSRTVRINSAEAHLFERCLGPQLFNIFNEGTTTGKAA